MNLRKKWFKLRMSFVVFVCTIILSINLFAAFEDTSVGAKPAALGGIYTSYADDVYSIYHNPAGLALLKRSEFCAQYSKLHVGLTDDSNLGYSFIGIGQPIKTNIDYGTVGFGWLRFELSELYQENTFIISYAKFGLIRKTNIGINLKYLSLGYGETDYTRNALDSNGIATGSPDQLFQTFGTSKGNIDFDLGFQYHLADNYRLGLMIANITEPNMALDPSVQASIPRTYKLGLTHTGKSYAATFDFLTKTINKTSVFEIGTGAEKQFDFGMALRGGLNIGSRELANLRIGLGYKFEGFQIDYALIYPLSGIKNTIGTHRFSLVAKFGPMIRSTLHAAELEAKFEKEKQLRLETEKKLVESRKEIARLRKELEELLKEPAIKVQPIKSLKDEDKKAKDLKIRRKSRPKRKAKTSEYMRELTQYKRSSTNMTIPQKINVLKDIVSGYKGKVRTTEAEQELIIMQQEYKAQSKYYRDSLRYFRRMVNQGIDVDEQISILKRVIRKFEKMGINVNEAKRLLGQLQ